VRLPKTSWSFRSYSYTVFPQKKKKRGPLLTLVNVASFSIIFLPYVHRTKSSKIKVLLFCQRVDPYLHYWTYRTWHTMYLVGNSMFVMVCYVHVCLCVCMYIYVYICLFTYICMYMNSDICFYVCM
jgi:hypothetical protein